MSTPSSTKWTVTPGHLDARLQRLADRVEAGEVGQQRGVDVDDAVAEAGDEGRAEQLHVAGEDDEVGAPRLDPVAHRGVAGRPVGVLVARGRPRSRPRPPRARSSALAPGLSEPTPTTSTPSRPCSRSRIACRFVPVPEARTTSLNEPAHGGIFAQGTSSVEPALRSRGGNPRAPGHRRRRSSRREWAGG